MIGAPPRLVTEGCRLLDLAEAAAVPLRLIGGVAVWERCSDRTRAALGRDYPDIDFVVHRRDGRKLRALLEQEGYQSEPVFNAVHGDRRLLYHAHDDSYDIDVFLDIFEMSHTLDFAKRLEVDAVTLPVADLLLAKLQIAEVNRKDLSDATMLLLDNAPSDHDGAGSLNLAHIAGLCGSNWGLYTTFTDNLARLHELILELPLDEDDRTLVGERVDEILGSFEAAPKSAGWRLRARLGRRVRWYQAPEEALR